MTEKAPSNQRPAKGDERNVVAVAPTAPEATLEERLAKFWADNRTFVIGAVVLVILAIIGREVWEQRVASQERAVRAAFGVAETSEAKLAFAREHAEHPLAGVALIAAADEAYEQADYSTAASRYVQAAAVLKEPIILARAKLGEAVSTLQSGVATKAETLLRQIGEDATAPEATRVEAWYHLGAYHLDAGNTAGAREALARVGEISPRSAWARRAANLATKLPPEVAMP